MAARAWRSRRACSACSRRSPTMLAAARVLRHGLAHPLRVARIDRRDGGAAARRLAGRRAGRRSSPPRSAPAVLILFRHRANLRRLAQRHGAPHGAYRREPPTGAKGAGERAHRGSRRRQLGHRARRALRPRSGTRSGCGRATRRWSTRSRRTRENPRYLPTIRGRATASLRRRRSRRRSPTRRSVIAAVPSHGMRAVARSAPRRCCATDAVLVSATKGLETDSLQRMSQVIAEETGGRPCRSSCSRARASRLEVARGLPTAVRRRLRATPAAATRVQDSFRGPTLRLYGSDDVAGVEIGGALKNVIAIAAGRRRGARARAQRDGRAHHPRAGRDLAAGVRRRRPARDAGRPERPRRSGADLHRRSEPQPPRRHRARARPRARRKSSPACTWSPKACARPAPRWRSARATASSCRSPRRWPPCSTAGDRRREAVEVLMGCARRRSEADQRTDTHGFFRQDQAVPDPDQAAVRRAVRRGRPPRRRRRSGAAGRSTSRRSRRSKRR